MTGLPVTLDPALLHAIRVNPDDDLPRLVAADWLEDHGDGQRAEQIRRQIASGRACMTWHREYGEHFASTVRWRRGFIAIVRVSWRVWDRRAANWLANHPIHFVQLLTRPPWGWLYDDLDLERELMRRYPGPRFAFPARTGPLLMPPARIVRARAGSAG